MNIEISTYFVREQNRLNGNQPYYRRPLFAKDVGVFSCRVTIFPCDYERLGCNWEALLDQSVVPAYRQYLLDEVGAGEEKWYIDHDEWREYVYFTAYPDALKFLMMWAS